MSDSDVQEVADQAIERGAEAAKGLTRFLPLATNMGGGMIALTVAVFAGSMAVGKFRGAYELSRQVKS